MEDGELYIWKNENDDYKLVWKVAMYDSLHDYCSDVFVDANNSMIISEIPRVRNSGTIGGLYSYKYFPEHYDDTPDVTAFSGMKVSLFNGIGQNVSETISAVNGYFKFNKYLSYAQYTVLLELKNQYVDIRDRNVLAIEYIYNFNHCSPTNLMLKAYPAVPENIVTKVWNASEATNLYYHANLIHDYYKNTFNYSDMDYPMEIVYDGGAYTNGSADGTSILFGSADGQPWAREADIIYHEYTHNVIYHLYGSFIDVNGDNYSQARAMDEGLADFFSCNITNDNNYGEKVGLSRNLINNYTWNSSAGRYYNGQVIGGVCWDLRSAVGKSTAEQVIFKALQLSPLARNFQDFLENLLLADQVLYNGAHLTAIIDAGTNHGIQIESFTGTITGPSSLQENQNGTWTVEVNGGLAPYTYSWEYKLACDGGGLNAAPCGYWLPIGNNSNNLTMNSGVDFEVKCTVSDATGEQIAISKYITVSSALPKIISQEENISKIPDEFSLKQNYPNPFNPETKIAFSLPAQNHVSIKVYNSLGEYVFEVVNSNFSAGIHEVSFNAGNLSSGTYFYEITAGKFRETRQMIILK